MNILKAILCLKNGHNWSLQRFRFKYFIEVQASDGGDVYIMKVDKFRVPICSCCGKEGKLSFVKTGTMNKVDVEIIRIIRHNARMGYGVHCWQNFAIHKINDLDKLASYSYNKS